MKKATEEQREAVRRAIIAVFSHLSTADIDRLTATHADVAYAGMQLGTSSQARAHTEHMRAVDEAVRRLSDFYTVEAANFIRGEGRRTAGEA